ncbi:MAG: LTA synthase family protein [Alloprevotella sp.]|nr:LTA synthase family protein [Alloprevotella sp.]
MKLRWLRHLAVCFFVFLLFFEMSKLAFLVLYAGSLTGTDCIQTLWHGLSLDLSVCAYLTMVPTLLTLGGLWTKQQRGWAVAATCFYAIASLIVVTLTVVNIALYGYWHFPLDTTPFFYFFSSPTDAKASAPLWQAAVGLSAIILLALSLFLLLKSSAALPSLAKTHKITSTLILLLTGGLLFLVGRGGITVSTMNTGHAYFSDRIVLNHAAVNPILSLGESLARENDFASQYRFFSDKEATRLFNELNQRAPVKTEAEQGDTILYIDRPDVLFVVLESFSAHLLPSLGGSPIATQLDSIAQCGLLFTDIYANSFRTDRGLVSILSAFPAQPTNSLMKYPRKTQNLPSIATALQGAGYTASYYYGGDANFTNMRSYLTNAGFQRIVSDKDFVLSERLSKWGAPDGAVFNRLLADIKKETKQGQHHLRVLQTSSSHEPFDVPNFSRFQHPAQNAFAYTDSCLGQFLRDLSRTEAWRRTLVVIVPDHQGCWPDTLDNLSPERYRIPLVLTGGALRLRGRNTTTGNQTDIIATVLSGMHLPGEAFPFSKNLLDPAAPHYAFFSHPDAMGLVRGGSCAVYDNATHKPHLLRGRDAERNLPYAKAFLQKLYDAIAER